MRGSYAAGPYRGRVVDAETKEPLVGAVVLMSWYRMAPGLGHASSSFMDAEETLTDERGEFVVGKNPPMNLMPLTWLRPPNMVIFLPGYAYYPRHYAVDPQPAGSDEALYALMEKQVVVFELPRLKTREERVFLVGMADPVTVPDNKKPLLRRRTNEDRKELGLPPVGQPAGGSDQRLP